MESRRSRNFKLLQQPGQNEEGLSWVFFFCRRLSDYFRIADHSPTDKALVGLRLFGDEYSTIDPAF